MSRLILLMLLFVGCTKAPPDAGTIELTRDTGSTHNATEPKPKADPLRAGIDFLLKQQSPDGAWRSDLYATFKDGPALTPLVVVALQEAAAENGPGNDADATVDSRKRGSDYLASLVNADGSIKGGNGDIDYPVYTAALCVTALSHPENAKLIKARDAWLRYLLDRQLTEDLGWKPVDKQYGGWGYCRLVPRKPEPNAIAPPLIESNLSATIFALEALRIAGVNDPKRYEASLTFVRRCQNADGGFHFIYDDPVRNKAGAFEGAPNQPLRFRSYGSTTADGLRGLLLCRSDESAAIERAKEWLQTHFRADSHPGDYVAAHERNREAVYYYYIASVSKAFRQADVTEAAGGDWATAITAELVKRQTANGSWKNPADLVRENEPIVATANALIALASCRRN